ncbi:MAG TPA: hypothetical protein PK358_03170 [Spirochaetota bacterium]|nr:hypothetical protein [Spirochaetota bacterium]
MKRIAAIIIFLFIATTNSFAVFFIDGFGANVDAGDMENQRGYGVGLGFDLNPDINFLFRTALTSVTENLNDEDETEYEHFTALAGLEYTPRIRFLSNYRISWKTSILAGVSNSDVEIDKMYGESESEMGIACSFWTGLQFALTRYISPFVDFGYHSSFYSDKFKDASIRGYQAAIGIRFYITGGGDYTGDYQ